MQKINFECPICSQHMYDVGNPLCDDEPPDFILYCPNCGYSRTVQESPTFKEIK